MTNAKFIECVAWQARQAVEAIADCPTLGGRKLAPPICHAVAPSITRQLSEVGIRASTIKGWFLLPDTILDHYWTETRGLIIDVTLDQLGPEWPAILIHRKAELLALGKYTNRVQEMGEVLRSWCPARRLQHD